jgi:hypothetical protein
MKPPGPFRKLLGKLNTGLLVVLKPLQIVNNFLFLAVAYFVGVGISSLLYRLGPGKKIRAGSGADLETDAGGPDSSTRASTLSSSYWRKLPQVSRDRNAWLRPF